MPNFLTTRELAALLRVKERKVYDLVAKRAVPVHKVTGKLLFARDEIDTWMRGAASTVEVADTDPAPPAVVAGGHDPLLEWALRQSGSGIAAFLDGALDGLRRAEEGGCIAAGLHIPEDGEAWNVATVAARFGTRPWVLVEWAWRTRGLMVRRDRQPPRTLAETRGLRFQTRQPEAGSELVLDHLLAREGLTRDALDETATCERSENDLALAVAEGRADVGLGIEAAARQHGLAFAPLVRERFDLLVRRRDWFEAPFQRFHRFCLGEAFRARAAALGGYDISGLGTVHHNGR